jgi:hypothetical protein
MLDKLYDMGILGESRDERRGEERRVDRRETSAMRRARGGQTPSVPSGARIRSGATPEQSEKKVRAEREERSPLPSEARIKCLPSAARLRSEETLPSGASITFVERSEDSSTSAS